jgi:hypothetical protein
MPDEVEFGSRPWHGAESPFEALYQWTVGQLAALRGELAPKPAPAVPVVAKPVVVPLATAPAPVAPTANKPA